MVEEAKRAIGFFCPSCQQAVIAEKNMFELTASNSAIQCPCGKSELKTEIKDHTIQLITPCLFCEDSHMMTCLMEHFLNEKIIAFSCGVSRLDCCYVGRQEEVYKAMNRLQETVDVLDGQKESESVFMNEIVMQEILEEIKEIGARGDISCTCGSHQWSVNLAYSAVEIICSNCGAGLKIPATTLSDVDDLCCKMTLTIRGKKD